jgi:hypothetical protein
LTDSQPTRLERLLPLACLAAAAVLFASELMVAFEFVGPDGEALDDQSASDRHYNAQIVLAAFAAFALAAVFFFGSKPAAFAVAACGGIALLLFLLVDLPDANNVGTLDDPRQTFATAEAVPQEGFWLELLGALGLALSGAALATMSPEQLARLRPGGSREAPPRAERREAAGPAVVDQERLGEEARSADSRRRVRARARNPHP